MADATMLLRLQQVNLDLMRTRKQVEELPQKEQITKIRKATKRVSSELSRIMGVRKDLELAISDNEDDHLHVSELVDEAQKRAEGQQDYRAIRDLEGQLTAYAKRLEKLEFDRAHLEEQLAAVQAKEQEYNAWLAKAKAEEDALLAAYKADVESAGNRMNDVLAFLRSGGEGGVGVGTTVTYFNEETAELLEMLRLCESFDDRVYDCFMACFLNRVKKNDQLKHFLEDPEARKGVKDISGKDDSDM